MALSPDNTFSVEDLLNQFLISSTAVAGSFLTQDTTDTSVVGVGDCNYGHVTTGSISVAGDRPLGVLFYDVTATGPSYFDQTAGVLNYSSAQGQPCALWKVKPGDIMATTAYASTGTGALTVGQSTGNTGAGSMLGLLNGELVLASAFSANAAGSVPVAKLIGNTMINGQIAVRVQIL